jgi:hypothetical protein
MSPTIRWCSIPGLLLALTACSGDPLEETPLHPDLVLSLGADAVEADGRTPLFVFPTAIRTSAASSGFYVLDNGRRRVVHVDSAGAARSIGRSGRGPGELAMLTGFDLAEDGTLWMTDAGNGKLVRYRGAEPVDEFLVNHAPNGVVALNGEVWVVGNLMHSLLVRYDSAGKRLGPVGMPLDTGRLAMRSNQGVAVRGEGPCAVVWAYSYRSVLKCFGRDGDLVWQTSGPILVEWDPQNDPFNMTRKDRFTYVDLSVSEGRVHALFVRKGNRTQSDQLHRFDVTDGRFLGAFRLPVPARGMTWQSDRVILTDYDPEILIGEYRFGGGG